MKPNRKATAEQREASRERFACPICSGRRIDIETVLLGGLTKYVCEDCGWWVADDPRTKRGDA